jgi:hypothetical protein
MRVNHIIGVGGVSANCSVRVLNFIHCDISVALVFLCAYGIADSCESLILRNLKSVTPFLLRLHTLQKINRLLHAQSIVPYLPSALVLLDGLLECLERGPLVLVGEAACLGHIPYLSVVSSFHNVK